MMRHLELTDKDCRDLLSCIERAMDEGCEAVRPEVLRQLGLEDSGTDSVVTWMWARARLWEKRDVAEGTR